MWDAKARTVLRMDCLGCFFSVVENLFPEKRWVTVLLAYPS